MSCIIRSPLSVKTRPIIIRFEIKRTIKRAVIKVTISTILAQDNFRLPFRHDCNTFFKFFNVNKCVFFDFGTWACPCTVWAFIAHSHRGSATFKPFFDLFYFFHAHNPAFFMYCHTCHNAFPCMILVFRYS